MERGEWENDPEYPRAPIPAHERTWRHPSEQGASQWVQSEPPLVVGRGLSMATGTVGVILAVGLLWLMIPHNNRGGGVAVQASTPARGAGEETFASRQSTPAALTNSLINPAPTTAVDTSTIPPSALSPTTVEAPLITFAPATEIERATTTTLPAPSAPAMAVALAPGHFVATTAAAVGSASRVVVQLPSGETVTGSVYSVDATSGIAIIALADGVSTSLLAASLAVMPTDAAVVLSPAPVPVSIWRDDNGTQLTSNPSIELSEGALVLDADSHLIGICTRASSGVHVIDTSALLAAINNAIASQAPAWLGLSVRSDDAGTLSVVEVYADGPAAAAGVQPGSAIRAIDGVDVTSLYVLQSGLLTHKPGDAATLTVVPPGATLAVDITITLAPNPGSL